MFVYGTKNHLRYANTAINLGEAQIRLGKLDEAEKNIIDALNYQEGQNDLFESTACRDMLAQVYETRGYLSKARKLRRKDIKNMVCSYTRVG